MWTSTAKRSERQLTEDADYYRRQSEEAQDQISRMYREEQETAGRRREERRQEHEYEQRQASSWPDALRKQISLMHNEAAYEQQEPELGTYFTETIAACRYALDLWPNIAEKRQAEVNALLAQIEQINVEVRAAVADALEVKNQDEYRQVAAVLREPDGDPSAWLDW